jgi:hypothetical protein
MAKPRTHAEIIQEANDWIADQWQGKPVKQVGGIPELIGRTGKVERTLWDEKGALHCEIVERYADRSGSTSFWCPASLLEQV